MSNDAEIAPCIIKEGDRISFRSEEAPVPRSAVVKVVLDDNAWLLILGYDGDDGNIDPGNMSVFELLRDDSEVNTGWLYGQVYALTDPEKRCHNGHEWTEWHAVASSTSHGAQ